MRLFNVASQLVNCQFHDGNSEAITDLAKRAAITLDISLPAPVPCSLSPSATTNGPRKKQWNRP